MRRSSTDSTDSTDHDRTVAGPSTVIDVVGHPVTQHAARGRSTQHAAAARGPYDATAVA